MNGWPVPAPPRSSTWNAEWPLWFDRWVGLRGPALLGQARKRLRAKGAGSVSAELLDAASRLAIAQVGDHMRKKGASWFHDAFVAELPFLVYTATAVEHEYVRLAQAEQTYRSNVTPVSPLIGAAEEEQTAAHLALAALEDGGAREALAAAEALNDYLERQAAPVRTALRQWWSGKGAEEISLELGREGERPAPHEVFVKILRCYRRDTVEVVAASIAAVGDPRDPCGNREEARSHIRAWILATEKFRVSPGGPGYSAEELAELVASRAAAPLGEKPEPFHLIARRLGRSAEAVEKQYQRLCADERHAWIAHITLNRHPGDPADPRDEPRD